MTIYELHKILVKMFPEHYIGVYPSEIVVRPSKYEANVNRIHIMDVEGNRLVVGTDIGYPNKPKYIPNFKNIVENIIKLSIL